MRNTDVIHFEIQLSEPCDVDWSGHVSHTIHNVSCDVMATTAERAIQLALSRHPAGTIHVVQRRGVSNLLHDQRIPKELIEDGQPTQAPRQGHGS